MTKRAKIYEQEGNTGYIEPDTSDSEYIYTWYYVGDSDDIRNALHLLEQVDSILPIEESSQGILEEQAELTAEDAEKNLGSVARYLDESLPEIWKIPIVNV